MNTTTHMFVRHDAPSGTLHSPYDGPFEVISRGNKAFKLRIRGKEVNISADRLKPAYIINEETARETDGRNNEGTTTRSGRTVRQPVRFAPTP